MVHVPVMFLSELCEFPLAPCLAEKKKLMTARVSMLLKLRVAWRAFFQPLWQEKTRKSPHEQTPLSKDTIDSVLRQREVGRSKDLSALRFALVKSRANFLGIKFSCCTFHHQEIVDGTVRSFTRICIPWWCKQRNSWLVDANRLRATERELTTLSHKQVGK